MINTRYSNKNCEQNPDLRYINKEAPDGSVRGSHEKNGKIAFGQ